jgi:hypothetical protein
MQDLYRETPHAKITYQPEKRLVIISPYEGALIDVDEYNLQFKLTHELTKGLQCVVLVTNFCIFNSNKGSSKGEFKPR